MRQIRTYEIEMETLAPRAIQKVRGPFANRHRWLAEIYVFLCFKGSVKCHFWPGLCCAGFIGSKIVNKAGEGILLDIVLGIVGAAVGGWVFNTFGAAGVTGLNLFSLL